MRGAYEVKSEHYVSGIYGGVANLYPNDNFRLRWGDRRLLLDQVHKLSELLTPLPPLSNRLLYVCILPPKPFQLVVGSDQNFRHGK